MTLFEREHTASHIIHALLSSASNEWYTPSIYIEAARAVMGGIDLDPASCEEANQTVKATTFYSKEENGLSKPLYGRVWCNPPYGTSGKGKSNQGIWTRRILADYEQGHIEQAIILTNAATDTRWFHALFVHPICFTEGRINYFSPIHKTDTACSRPERGTNTHGSAFTYLGPHTARFIETFRQFGTIVQCVARPHQQFQPVGLWEDEVSA